ncbi:MAG: methyltransferase domain-containing protein, partial [Candidatus Chisholmbacteria bacterium]|nr:methyltransferase domain-containing protein [Candidatus Chisholmbacteria bacterium]
WGIDANKQAVAFCHQRNLPRVYQEKFPHLKKITAKFDVITCLDVLEHIETDRQALGTIKKLLKSGGYAIITVPAYPWLFSYWDTILGHYRRYSKTELKQKVKKAHLTIVKLSFVYAFLLPPVIPFRLIRHQLFKAKTPRSDFIKLPAIFHAALFFLATIEQKIIARASVPFGVSLLCVVTHK